MKRIAVIGGGISGLAAAFSLQKVADAGEPLEYQVFESSGRIGGVLRTERFDGCVLEAGPDSFLTEKPWAADLCRDLGLEDQLIGSNDAERKTYIVLKGRLAPIPDGMMFMAPTRIAPVFLSPLFSLKTKLRVLQEWFYKPRDNQDEPTVAEFVAQHYGREMVDRIADPLLAGVYGGSADQLSANAVLPRFVEMEAKYRSLGKAMLAVRKTRPVSAKPLFTSLKNGMAQMVDALVQSIPAVSRRLNTSVAAVKPESNKWLVISNGRTEEFDAVVLAVPAYVVAPLLAHCGNIAQELQGIRYSSSLTVSLVYDGSVRKALPPGFGFLSPRAEGGRILAATFVHAKFPHRAPPKRAVVRCFLGGSKDEDVLAKSDAALIDIVRSELRRILNLHSEPLAVRVARWPRAMAQYEVGHLARVARIRDLLGATPGLALAGNAYSGIGIPDCVRSGTEAVQKVLAETAAGGNRSRSCTRLA